MAKKILIFSLIALFIISAVLISIYQYQVNAPAGKSSKEIGFNIEKGESVKKISERLYDNGLIRSRFFFELFIKLNDKQARLQAGDYVLMPVQNIRGIVESLGNGKERVVRLLIKEGESETDIAKSLEAQKMFSADEFYASAGWPMADHRAINKTLPDFSFKYGFLDDKPKYYGLEGYLFPDTYLLSKNSKPEQVIIKILDNFDKKLTAQMREDIAQQGKTIYETIIMASIVEKEVKTAEDMKIVSGIFWKRLSIGQALQSDATLSYALDDTTAAHSLEELKSDSPYNSYRYKGLPPTPIGNPGINAIIAAIYPTATDYNFFLTSKDNRTIFSKDFEEHVRNKNKYLK